MKGFEYDAVATDWFAPPAHFCHHRRCWCCPANTAVMARDRWIPRAFACKNQGLETFPQAASLHLRLICTRPCLWLCVVAVDKVRTDVFGVISTLLLPPPLHDPLFPPVSSSFNLGLIVFVIKHSCTDPSANPLTSPDYMGVRGALLPHGPVQQPCTPHANALLAP